MTRPSPVLYWHTVRHLDPEQIRHQVLRRLPRLRRERLPRSSPTMRIEVGSGWEPRVERCRVRTDTGVLDGRFRFWGIERQLDLSKPWQAPDLGRSWNHPVHYFDAAPALASQARSVDEAALRLALEAWIAQWIEVHEPGRGLAWESYPTALRIVNWLDVVATLGSRASESWRDAVLRSLYAQAEWLASHLERHLLGTHLLKDAKALSVAGRVFGSETDKGWSVRSRAILDRELRRQVHADGGHIEPSVLYHGIALEDVLDLLAFEIGDSALQELLRSTAESMLAHLVRVRPPVDGWPLLGDAAVDAEPSPQALLDYGRRLGMTIPGDADGLWLASESGRAVWRDPRQYLLADVGPIGPPHLSPHGHCDSLSFEWHVDGVSLVVDSGTSSYERGAARQASRGTRAHNTLEIDGREQHEIWAAFRVGRRSAVQCRVEGPHELLVELVPWHDRRLHVERRFVFGAGSVRILDRIEGSGSHRVVSRLHFHPDCDLHLEGRTLHVTRGAVRASIELPEAPRYELLEASRSRSSCCESFGVARPNACLEAVHTGPLPYASTLILRVGA